MDFTSKTGADRYAALLRVAPRVLVGLDFDGTLSPLVDDPEVARIHPDAPGVLVDLARYVGSLAIVTGRPAEQVLDLGDFESVGQRLAELGKDLHVVGQYGNERWSSQDPRIIRPQPPAGLSAFEEELPEVLERLDAREVYIEEKGLAVAIHTRRVDEPEKVFERLLPGVRDLAEQFELTVESGKDVVEVRGTGMDKGQALRRLARSTGAAGCLYVGDDLGDVEAFEALVALEAEGLATLRVCADPDPSHPLWAMADVVVDGPAGVLELLRGVSAHVGSRV